MKGQYQTDEVGNTDVFISEDSSFDDAQQYRMAKSKSMHEQWVGGYEEDQAVLGCIQRDIVVKDHTVLKRVQRKEKRQDIEPQSITDSSTPELRQDPGPAADFDRAKREMLQRISASGFTTFGKDRQVAGEVPIGKQIYKISEASEVVEESSLSSPSSISEPSFLKRDQASLQTSSQHTASISRTLTDNSNKLSDRINSQTSLTQEEIANFAFNGQQDKMRPTATPTPAPEIRVDPNGLKFEEPATG